MCSIAPSINNVHLGSLAILEDNLSWYLVFSDVLYAGHLRHLTEEEVGAYFRAVAVAPEVKLKRTLFELYLHASGRVNWKSYPTRTQTYWKYTVSLISIVVPRPNSERPVFSA